MLFSLAGAYQHDIQSLYHLANGFILMMAEIYQNSPLHFVYTDPVPISRDTLNLIYHSL